jgi:hypothetical protein
VSDELERRLRESLRAYADLVDAPDDDSLPTAPATARPALRRWRGAILAAAAAAAVVTGSVWAVSDRGGDSTSAAGSAGSAVSAPDTTRAEAPPSDSGAAAAESGGLADSAVPAEGFALPPPLEVGVTYPVDLYTHCGIRGLDLDGRWFAADPPLVEEGGNPPPGWDNPTQRGTVSLLTHDTAVFRDDAGHEVRLHADEAARPRLCA